MSIESVFRIVFWVLYPLFFIVREHYDRKVERSAKRILNKSLIEREGLTTLIIRLVLVVILIPALALYIINAINPKWLSWIHISFPIWLRYIGLGLAIVSFPLSIWVHRSLGIYWFQNLQLRGRHKLITDGPYRWIRHPMYLSFSLLMIGLILLSANWMIMLLFVLELSAVYARIGEEENMMKEQFGTEYDEYIKRTGRLILRLIR